jgi:hypothetical protein
MNSQSPTNQNSKQILNYAFFSYTKRCDLQKYIERLSNYLAVNNIRNVAFVDRSARAAWVGVHKYWSLHFKNRKRPNIYFFNPDGFSERDAKRKFVNTFTRLITEKDLPMIVFDTCAHTGGTLRSITKILNILDFKDVNIITANSPSHDSNIKTACTIDEGANHNGCYPFGTVDLISKTNGLLCCRGHYYNRHDCIRIREEIKSIICYGPE